MRLFLKRLFVFGLVILLALALWELTLRSFPNTYDVKKSLLESEQSEVEILFLGTSHVFSGINPERIDRKSINLANNSQSLYYDIEIVRNNLAKLSALKTVVFEINFFSFYYNLDLGPEKWRNIFYYQSFGIRPQTAQVGWLDLSRVYQLKRNGIIMLLQSQEQNELYFKKLGFGGVEDDGNGPAQKYAKKKYNSFAQEYINYSDDFLVQDLSKLLMQLRERNVDVYFLRFPASSYLTNYIKDSNYLDSTDNLLNALVQKFDARELNYFDDHRFNDDLFYDSDHLNSRGAKILTEFVNEGLKETTFE